MHTFKKACADGGRDCLIWTAPKQSSLPLSTVMLHTLATTNTRLMTPPQSPSSTFSPLPTLFPHPFEMSSWCRAASTLASAEESYKGTSPDCVPHLKTRITDAFGACLLAPRLVSCSPLSIRITTNRSEFAA